MAKCLIAVGCNQGDCRTNIRKAVKQIESLPGTHLLGISNLLETTPVIQADEQFPVDGVFLNGALLVETTLDPHRMMQHLLEFETVGGRNREQGCGNRPLDLDILLFDELILDSDALAIPHPRMSFRRFVLEPAVEIAGDMLHPELGQNLGDLLKHIVSERNIVVVLDRDQNLDLNSMRQEYSSTLPEKEKSGMAREIEWMFSNDFRNVLLSLRKQILARQGWLVVVTSDSQLLVSMHQACKLLVVVEHKKPSVVHRLTDGYQGPGWFLEPTSFDILYRNVNHAIQAMKPV